MVITYHGGQCFKVSFGGTTLVFNPISKGSKFSAVKFGADVAFISLNHPDFNGIEQVTYGDRAPFIISGPGEYEVGDVTVRGFGIETVYDKAPHYNSVYQVTLEGMTLVFLGAIHDGALDTKIFERLADTDILFVPIGGGDVLDAAAASALGVKLEAHIVIPMHYEDSATLKAFLKEESAEDTKPEDKLTIKKKDLAGREGDIVVLTA